jgi:hypothetical protein
LRFHVRSVLDYLYGDQKAGIGAVRHIRFPHISSYQSARDPRG